ncbi:hypothetical protein DXG01_012164, partial [Tephrocybe rancida]
MSEFSATDDAPLPTEGETHSNLIPVGNPTGDQVPHELESSGNPSFWVPSLLGILPATVDLGGRPIYPGVGEAGPLSPAGESVIPAINIINPTPMNLQDQPSLPGPPAL